MLRRRLKRVILGYNLTAAERLVYASGVLWSKDFVIDKSVFFEIARSAFELSSTEMSRILSSFIRKRLVEVDGTNVYFKADVRQTKRYRSVLRAVRRKKPVGKRKNVGEITVGVMVRRVRKLFQEAYGFSCSELSFDSNPKAHRGRMYGKLKALRGHMISEGLKNELWNYLEWVFEEKANVGLSVPLICSPTMVAEWRFKKLRRPEGKGAKKRFVCTKRFGSGPDYRFFDGDSVCKKCEKYGDCKNRQKN